MNRDETVALFLQGKEAWNAWAEPAEALYVYRIVINYNTVTFCTVGVQIATALL
jgi:hypothetical protein